MVTDKIARRDIEVQPMARRCNWNSADEAAVYRAIEVIPGSAIRPCRVSWHDFTLRKEGVTRGQKWQGQEKATNDRRLGMH